jgi:hypothetical protein
MSNRGNNFVPKLYYAVTPVFMMLDYIWGINIRVAVLDNYPLYKGLYYVFCILCGVIIYLVPRGSAIVTLIESIIIIMMTVLGVLLPYVQAVTQAADIMNADFDNISIVHPQYIINLVLVGGIAVLSFHKSLRELGLEGKREFEEKFMK